MTEETASKGRVGPISTVGKLFPSLTGVPGPEPADLAATFDLRTGTVSGFVAAIDAITAALVAAAAIDDIRHLQSVAMPILDDVMRARSVSDSLAARYALDFLAFMTAGAVANATLMKSDGGRAHEWWVRSLADEYHGDDVYRLGQIRLALWRFMPTKLKEFAAEVTARWIAGFFLHAWTFGQYVDLAGELFDVAGELDVAIDRGQVPELVAALSMIFRAQWALRYRPGEAQGLADRLERMLRNPETTREVKARIAMFFAVTDTPLTSTPQDQRATTALADYTDCYNPDERLALLISTCWGRIDDLLNRLAVLCEVARDASRHRIERVERPSGELYNRDVQFDRIGTAVRVLAEAGHTDEAVELIAAWHGVANHDVLHAAVVGLAVSAVNTRWCHSSATQPPPEPDEDVYGYGDLDDVVSAIGRFFGVRIANGSNPDFPVWSPERPGIPNHEFGAEFETAATRHLRFDALAEVLSRAVPASALVMVPGMALPIQPLMIRRTGVLLPLSVSLKLPRRCRPIERAVVISGETFTSPWETDTVTALLRNAGVDVIRIDDVTRDEFGRIYREDDLDLVWITGHGLHDHAHPDQSALLFRGGEPADMDWLAGLDAPGYDRRLLVLNVCSGGQSTMWNSPYGFGIAPALAGPSQTVISHLWPTAAAIAASFGVLLAQALTADGDHVRAFKSAVETLAGGADRVLGALGSAPAEGPRLAEHLASASHDLANIAHWGSPTLHT